MFLTPQQLNLSESEINRINEEVFQKQNPRNCPDCGVKSGEVHKDNCDVSYCEKHKRQTLMCTCTIVDKWDGLWPGTKYCYDRKLIVFDTCLFPNGNYMGWMFDYNEYAKRRAINEL